MIAFGTPHEHLAECTSTNDRLRELAEGGAPGGFVVTAGVQTAGRGRQGRTWVAPPGKALLYSALLRPLTLASEVLPLAVPLAVCEAVEALAPVECRVKWPNDVWIEERKVAGVLIEARADGEGGFAVIGVGLNVSTRPDEFPSDVREIATSVGHGATVDAARDRLNACLGEWVGRHRGEVIAEFERRDVLIGREIEWLSTTGPAGSLTGVARGVTLRGELRVDLPDGDEIHLSAGEVHLKRLEPPGDYD